MAQKERRKPKRLSAKDSVACAAMYKNGATMADIMTSFDVSSTAIYRAVDAHKVPRRGRGRYRGNGVKNIPLKDQPQKKGRPKGKPYQLGAHLSIEAMEALTKVSETYDMPRQQIIEVLVRAEASAIGTNKVSILRHFTHKVRMAIRCASDQIMKEL